MLNFSISDYSTKLAFAIKHLIFCALLASTTLHHNPISKSSDLGEENFLFASLVESLPSGSSSNFLKRLARKNVGKLDLIKSVSWGKFFDGGIVFKLISRSSGSGKKEKGKHRKKVSN